MPGILGIILAAQPANVQPAVMSMLSTLRHRADFITGTERFDRFRSGAGWTCHPGAFADCMPAWNERRDVCLIFTGEHFSTDGRLTLAGSSASDTLNAASLVSLYEQLGDDFFLALNGTFSGLLVDCRYGRERIVLFNDRYGLCRIYIHESGSGFYFSSEAKALLKVLPQLRELSHKSLAELYTCGCVMQNRTLFPQITLLPGGSAWSFTLDGRVEKRSYFDRTKWERHEQLPLGEYANKTGNALDKIIPRYFTGPEPIAMSLTGGADSRMIMAASGSLTKFPCYTFGGMYRECADVRISRQIAGILGHPHQVIRLTRGFFSAFPSLARQAVYRTDGTMDVSGAGGLFVNALARQVAPIRMTGNYGGEILRALLHFKPSLASISMFNGEFQALAREAAATYHWERDVHRASFVAFKQVPWSHYGRFALEQSELTIRTPFLDNALVELSYHAPPQAYVDKAPAFQFIRTRCPALARVPTDRGFTARFTWLPVKTRRLLTEFMPRAEYVYDYGMPQWLAKIDRCTAPLHIERLFLGRQKYSHYRIWYRRELSSFVKEVLLDPRTMARPYLNKSVVERMVHSHVNGSGNYTTEIHKLLTTEMIERHLIRDT